MRHIGLALAALAVAGPTWASDAPQTAPAPAALAGHAALPAATTIAPPADAPADARLSGKFTGPTRVETPGARPGDTGPLHGARPTGVGLPLVGQPIQGFSGFAMNRAPDGSLYVLSDNGFGAKRNSADALLAFHRVAPDWESGAVDVRETVFLRDPDKIVPFRIVTEGSAARYLTGGDFDPESIQVRGDEVWIGEEFGPYLIRATLDGRVTGLFPTAPEGTELRSPDHPAVFVPAAAGADYRVGRSSGFEGMALSPDGSRLWALFEKPLLDAAGAPEGRFLRAYAFDPQAGAWTGETFKLALAEGATAIGDFNFVDGRRALVIERDDGEGDPSLACAGEPRPECFPNPARLKRVLLVDVTPDAAGFARRLGEIDLMDVADPDGRARIETAAARDLTGRFTLPFQTIENVALWDDGRIVVAVDNNLPFSTGRALDRAADGEFVLLDAAALLDRR